MKRKYQVFVSSTFLDLSDERQAVIKSLLEMDCIPVGMEIFPAANEPQWDFIKRVIRDCDYYLVIVGGKYGSIGPDGVSYTESEYRYAIDSGIPVIAFLHDDRVALSPNRREKDKSKALKLTVFRNLCMTKLCQFWSTPDSLAARVATSIPNLTRNHPTSGWVRGADVEAIEKNCASSVGVIRKIADGILTPYTFAKRSLTHFAQPDGSGILEEQIQIRYESETPQFFVTRYGHYAKPQDCSPIVKAWDLMDSIELPVVEIKRSNISAAFAILLNSQARSPGFTEIKLRCDRPCLWKDLLEGKQVDNEFLLERFCQDLSFRFVAPSGRKWHSLRSSLRRPIKLNSDQNELEWILGSMDPATINYSLKLA